MNRAQAITALAVDIGWWNRTGRPYGLLQRESFNRQYDHSTLLIGLCTDIYPGEVYDEIKKHENDKVDYLIVGMESVDRAMVVAEIIRSLASAKREQQHKIGNSIGELKNWAYFKK